MHYPVRRNPASGVRIQSSEPTLVLLTVTSSRRNPWLACDAVHDALHVVWREATAWLVGNYLLMPEHLHMFCAPRDPTFPVERWITYWKSRFSRQHEHPSWKFQSRGWHHRLRNQREYREKWLYVRENPVRRGLVDSSDAWPYQGCVFELRW
jgi:putative transposase